MIVEELMMNFGEFLFYCCKRILIWQKIVGFLETLFEYYFLNIIVNVNFFSGLKFEYQSLLP